MKTNHADQLQLGQILTGVALGALCMYLFDPVQGNRRRALIRDQARSMRIKTAKAADATSRDLLNRVEGLGAETRGKLSELKQMISESSRP